jgi:hypothetical protein
MDVEVMILTGYIHKFPAFRHRLIAGSQRQTDGHRKVIERLDVFECSRNSPSLLIEFLVAESKCIGRTRWDAKIDTARVRARPRKDEIT